MPYDSETKPQAFEMVGAFWKTECPPFQIAPHVYFVGMTSVSAYLFDTGDGLILLDQAFSETVYLIFENIRRLGFDPKDIKRLLISHAHFDHCGGTRLMQEYSGAKICLSREDWAFMRERPEWATYGYPNWLPFEPDSFYRDDTPVRLGRFQIRTQLTPGHTPGTTSFFFDTTDERSGQTYACAMHGGIGLNTMCREWYEQNPDWDDTLWRQFVRDADQLGRLAVDIALPSHPNQIPILSKVAPDPLDYRPFVDPAAWLRLMQERTARVRAGHMVQ